MYSTDLLDLQAKMQALKMEEEDGKTQLPYDVLVNVLMRVPTKYHYRFRFAAKNFGSILDDPYFRNLFPVRLFLFVRLLDSVGQHFYSVDLSNQDATKTGDVAGFVQRIRIRTSLDSQFTKIINGLVCHHSIGERLYLYKISTQESMQLPLLPNPFQDAIFHFGFDPTKNVYKLLMSMRNLSAEYICHILTVGESTWRRLPTPNCIYFNGCESICVGGVIYWAWEATPFIRRTLVTFDLKNEVFGDVGFSWEMENAREFVLARYRDSLALIKATSDTELTIWILRGKTWDKYTVCVPSWDKYTVCVPSPSTNYKCMYIGNKCKFIGNLRSGEMLVRHSCCRRILVCDLMSGSCWEFKLSFPTLTRPAMDDVLSACDEDELVSLKDIFGFKAATIQA